MTQNSQRLIYVYLPLWGATLNPEDAICRVGGNWGVMIPYVEEWQFAQKTDVWIEKLRLLVENSTIVPPVCLFTLMKFSEEEDFYQVVKRMRNSVIDESKDVISALRLLKAGWFLDPEFSEQIFTSAITEGMVARFPGPYRQLFLAGVPQGAPEGYDLRAEELSSSTDQTSITQEMWNLVHKYRQGKPHSSADIAIENFNRSYGYQLMGTQRAAFLFIALDAILGGMSGRRLGRVRFKSTFRSRVEVALKSSTHQISLTEVNADEEASWLDTQGRDIRNAIAHGRSSSVAASVKDNIDRLQTIIRLLLAQFIKFSIEWTGHSLEISSKIQITQQYSPVEAFNRILDLCSRKYLELDQFEF